MALWRKVRTISRPVESPCAWRMRLRLWAPSRPKTRLVPWRSKAVPHAINCSMAAGPSSTRVWTASASQSPSPATRVSCSCSSTSSSSLRAAAIPPCAYSDEDSRRLSLAITRTRPIEASSIAALRPATPAPTTMKSVRTRWTGGVTLMVQRDHMPTFEVQTAQRTYASVVERGIVRRIKDYIPRKAGKVFLVTTEDVWKIHADKVEGQLLPNELNVLFFPGGESNKRLSAVEALAEQMVERAGERTSIVIGFGGGIVTDVSGFLAAIYLRGVPVLQIPTTLLAQVDAGIGGKTGVNMVSGKNLIGSFHQPLAVLIDPDLIGTLPEREYRAGLFEVIKCGIIRDRELFNLMAGLPN